LFFITLFHLPTAEAFDRKAQEVNSLQYFSKLINEVLDFKDLSETVSEIAMKLCNAEAAWIIWLEEKENKIISLNNISKSQAEEITAFIFNQEILNQARTEVASLERLNLINPDNIYTSAASAPLKTHNETRGYILAVKKNNFIFDEEDRDAMDTFSDYASVAIENSRLLKESIEKERLEKELDVAREIQRKIIPAKNPEYKNLSISSVFIPAFEVGGDYFDFFEISEDKLGFVIADVSGKGISAAFIMAEIKGIFESLSTIIESPKEIIIKANQILKRTLDRRTFVSAVYGIINFSAGTITVTRAGHCPMILIRDGEALNLKPSGIGLGLNFTNYFEETLEEIQLDFEDDDIFVLYTDGITEAKNNLLEDFGEKEFKKIILENAGCTADEISNKVIKEVTLFSQTNSQHDDITLVIFKWNQKLKKHGVKEWQNLTPQLNT
jgi:phosphoserine phosphatase RsbU/P